MQGKDTFAWVIHITANTCDTPLFRSADLGNVFRHKMAIQYLKQVHRIAFKTSSKSSLGDTVLHVSLVGFKKD